ncbi:MAG: hypothetical protein OEY86_10505 [Nitrospira sp.]|nr:hypothetical protein [Nitrospira sp.]
MTHDSTQGLAVVRQQIAELDALLKQTTQDLNTVAGAERVAKWRIKTVALLTDAVGQEAGKKFAGIQPGPSFTNDLLEEFTDLVDCYRTPLTTLAKQLAQAAHPGS